MKDLPKEIQPVFSLLCNFHATNLDKINLTNDDLANLVAGVVSKDKDYYLGVVDQIGRLDVNGVTTSKLIQRIIANKQLNAISLAAHDAKEGRLAVEEAEKLFKQFLEHQSQEEEVVEDMFASDDLSEILSEAHAIPGLRWRLKTLNEMLGSLRRGDFGFLFARPESGKTTFLASETTYMASQLTEEDGPILWINNEEQSSKVMLRCIQAATGCTLTQLYSDVAGYDAKFRQLTHGKIKIIKDVSLIHKNTVESLCKKHQPSLIIFDQLDKVVGFDSDRDDLKLGAIYQWARDLAKRYGPVIAVTQADGTGEGVKWLTMAHVANAKTSKQAEADWILGIGKTHDPGYENVRYLHLSKNKLMGDHDSVPDQRHGKRECLIEPTIARYKDIA